MNFMILYLILVISLRYVGDKTKELGKGLSLGSKWLVKKYNCFIQDLSVSYVCIKRQLVDNGLRDGLELTQELKLINTTFPYMR